MPAGILERLNPIKVAAKARIWFLLVLLLSLTLAVFYAPSFLVLSEVPVKSDAVVLFLGGEKGTRLKEAHQLIREGFADNLIIPAYGQVEKFNPDGKLQRVDHFFSFNASNAKQKIAAWLEDTHEEVIIARGMIEHLGFKSVILVSSSYHMRRIKLIAEKVFRDTLVLHYVPTRYETQGKDFWLFNSREWKYVLTEYAKITWFLMYNPFV